MQSTTEGMNIVTKFWHGLSPIIQNYITCLTYGWPSNDTPKDWYGAVILCDENHIANSAFQLTLWSTQTTTITGGGAKCNPVTGVTKPVHSAPGHATAATPSIGFVSRPPWDPNAMNVNATWRQGPNPIVCYWCGKTGHTRPNCPEAFNVCTMMVEECTDFIQHELTALDVHTPDLDWSEEVEEIAQGETSVELGFTSHNKWIVCPCCDPRIIFVRKTLKLNSLFFFIYFHPREPKHGSKCSQTDHGNNNSHPCNYSVVYAPVCVHPCSMIKYSKIYIT